jgi:hypothetical protein
VLSLPFASNLLAFRGFALLLSSYFDVATVSVVDPEPYPDPQGSEIMSDPELVVSDSEVDLAKSPKKISN